MHNPNEFKLLNKHIHLQLHVQRVQVSANHVGEEFLHFRRLEVRFIGCGGRCRSGSSRRATNGAIGEHGLEEHQESLQESLLRLPTGPRLSNPSTTA